MSEDTYKKYDFCCPELKLIIEFNGDHYHGNPVLYKPDDHLKGRGCTKFTAKELWKKDKLKSDLAVEARKFDVIVVWELDYEKDPIGVIKRILDYVYR